MKVVTQAVSCLLALSATLCAGGFDRAIVTANARVVKLYGLAAGAQLGYGTGIVVSPDGRVLTVLSLLIDARRVRAVTSEGTRFAAQVLARDAERQLALLQLVPWEDAERGGVDSDSSSVADSGAPRVGPFPSFDPILGTPLKPSGDPEFPRNIAKEPPRLQPGDWIVAAGNAFKVAEGSEPVSFVRGVFSTRTRLDARRRVRDFPYRGEVLVVDAVTSNPGAPGGAVVNLHGFLVGMVGRDVVSNLTNTHFNYAIPGDVLAAFLRDTETKKNAAPTPTDSSVVNSLDRRSAAEASAEETMNPSRDVGIRLARAGYQKVLPFVERVKLGSPAAQAGLQKDDLILSLNGKNIGDVADFHEQMKMLGPDEPVDLVVRRDRRILSLRMEPTRN